MYKKRDLIKEREGGKNMNKILNFVEEKLAPPLNKMANQHHLNAVKNGMMVTGPSLMSSIAISAAKIPRLTGTSFSNKSLKSS